MCKPYLDYQKINPNTQLMIVADCQSGCTNVNSIYYQYKISKLWNIVKNDAQVKWIPCTSYNATNSSLSN